MRPIARASSGSTRSPPVADSAVHHGDAGGRGRVPAAGAGAGPRGRHGEIPRRALHRRWPRFRLAEGQAGPHARSGGAGRGVGQRPPPRLAQQPAPRGPRTRQRRLGHARQDVQGPHRRHAPVADRAAAGTGGAAAAATWSTSGPSWWWRLRSTRSRPVLSILPAWRCASPGSSAIASTRGQRTWTPSTPCGGSSSSRAAARRRRRDSGRDQPADAVRSDSDGCVDWPFGATTISTRRLS